MGGMCAFSCKNCHVLTRLMFKRVSGEIVFNFQDSKLQSDSIPGTLTLVRVPYDILNFQRV